MAERGRVQHPDRHAVHARPAAAPGREELARHGVVDDARQDLPAPLVGEADAPGADAVQKAPGAVDRVDHPVPAPGRVDQFVLVLLADEAVVGEECGEPAADQGLDLAVGLAHQVMGTLALDHEAVAPLVEAAGEAAGLAGHGFGGGEAKAGVDLGHQGHPGVWIAGTGGL
jgi:hypothetical protein